MSDLSSSIDVKNATIHLVGEVDESMYLTVQRGIGSILRQQLEPYFTINTYGGNITDAFAIHDLIKMCCPNANMGVFGVCMSAGMVILQAANERTATTSSELMIHYGTEETDSGQSNKFNGRLRKKENLILSGRLKVSPATIKKWQNGERYFDANEALKYGLIDRIVT